MPYGVGGAIAEGLQSGFEMGRSINQDAERKREFEVDAAIKREQADRLWQQEKDRYGRMQDAAQVQATQDQLAQLDKLAQGMQERGLTVSPELNMQRAQLAQQLAQMHGQIATTGRLAQAQPAGVTSAAPRPNVASADLSGAPAPTAPLPDLSQAAAPSSPVGGPQATPAPAPGGVGAMGAQGVRSAQSQPPTGLGPQSGPVGMGVDGLAPAGVSSGGALPAGAAAAPAPAMPGGAPQAASVASPTTSAVTPQQTLVTQTDQDAQDLASRLHTGQVSLTDVAPKDLALMVASATKHPPGDLSGLNQGIADFHAGMTTGNNGLTIQGLNGVYGPAINTGVGQPSQYGGNVVSKEIVGINPAMSADGSIHPDRVMSTLKVTTDQTGPDGTPLYYHAPLLGADGKVAAIPLADAFNHVGAMGALTATLAHPDAQAALAQGAKDPAVKAYFDAYNSMAAPLSKADVLENQIQATMQRTSKPRGEVEQMYRNAGAIPWQLSVPHGVGQSDAAFIQDIMQHNPGMSYEDAAALAQRTTHAITKYSPGAGGGAGVQGSGGSLTPSGTPNPVTGSAVLPAPDKNGLIFGFTPRAIDNYAVAFADGIKPPAVGRGETNANFQRLVANRMGELMERAGVTPEQYVAGTTQYKADTKSLMFQQSRTDAIDAGMDKVKQDIGTISDTIQKGNLDFQPWLNQPINAVREKVGSGPLSAYLLSVHQVAIEYERLINGGQMSVAQLHQGAQDDAAKILNGNMNIEQVQSVLPIMVREMQHAQDSAHSILATVHGRLASGTLGSGANANAPAPGPGGVQSAAAPTVGAKPTQIQTAADYAALPSGTQYIDPTGVARTKQ